MSHRHSHPVPLCFALAALLSCIAACGADGGGAVVDAGMDVSNDVGAGSQDTSKLDVAASETLMAADGPPADAQPTVSVEASVAFAEIAGSYSAKAANVSDGASALFDNGQPYTFSINANGTFSVGTKGEPQVFTWAMHANKITRNTKNNVTVIEFADAGKRLLNITYLPGTGPFDIAGVMLDPNGRWYLTGIAKM